MREAALLQSFPPGYRFSLSAGKQAIALLIGNALPPELIRRHALAVRQAICETSEGVAPAVPAGPRRRRN